ncbi:hypothetical protein, partial [Citrobacter amalonaticus]|uniref:hypothetical protein n=1 Tax=Citrobacter amalonaticus TaxID=35703 RepID=UPI0020A22016
MPQYGLYYGGVALFDKMIQQMTDAKKPIRQDGLLRLFDAWQFPTLAWGDPTLPSALRRFTS